MAACTLLALVVSVLAASAIEEPRQVGPFTGIHVNGGIELMANNSTNGSSSLTLSASAEILSTVSSHVDRWGTLVLSRRRSASYASHVEAMAMVPGPLTYAGAAFGGRLAAFSVAGFVVASNQGHILMSALESSRPLSLVASSNSSIMLLSHGQVPLISISCAGTSEVHLGPLRVNESMISVSSSSQVTGMTANVSTIMISSNSSLQTTATQTAGVSCSKSEVGISGSAEVMTYFNQSCTVKAARTSSFDGLTSAEAPVYP